MGYAGTVGEREAGSSGARERGRREQWGKRKAGAVGKGGGEISGDRRRREQRGRGKEGAVGREGGGDSGDRGSSVGEGAAGEQWGEREERERGGWHDRDSSEQFARIFQFPAKLHRVTSLEQTSLLVPRGEPPYLGYPGANLPI